MKTKKNIINHLIINRIRWFFAVLVLYQIFFTANTGNGQNNCITYYDENNPDHAQFDLESKAVVYIVKEGITVGTGILINNTNNDGKAYVLTAAHIIDAMDGQDDDSFDQSSLNTAKFYFNRKWISGSLYQEGPITGASIVAASPSYSLSNFNTDWILLKLNSSPITNPYCYDVSFLGWDATNDNIASSLIFGHPARHPLTLSIHNAGGTISNEMLECDFTTGMRQATGASGGPIINEDNKLVYAHFVMGAEDYSCYISDFYIQQASLSTTKAFRALRIKYIINSNPNLKAALDPQNKGICPSLTPADLYITQQPSSPVYMGSMKYVYIQGSSANPITIMAGSIIGGKTLMISNTTILSGSYLSKIQAPGSPCNYSPVYKSLYPENTIAAGSMQKEKEPSLHVNPNPIVNSAQVTFFLEKSERVKLSLWNMMGEQVKVISDETLSEGEHSIGFETSELQAGLYLIVKETSSERATQKILITR